jgi:very-short-patch-repair endonuclease
VHPAPPSGWIPPQARLQAGLFTTRQALDSGMTRAQVRHRRGTALWIPFAGAALRHRDAAPHQLADAYAACLTWPDAVTCLGAAARVHQLPVATGGPVRAVVPHARGAQLRLVPMRYALADSDVLEIGPLRVTTLERTVFDCVGLLPARSAEELVIWVLTRRILSHAEMSDAVTRRRGAQGNQQRRALLDATRNGAMGVAEQRLHRILHGAGITGWAADRPVQDRFGLVGSADVLFPRERLIIEVDGMAYHGASQFQSDRTRQNRLVLAGYTVLRFTWDDLVSQPRTVAAHIRQALQALRSHG